jgi:hypothetical protein
LDEHLRLKVKKIIEMLSGARELPPGYSQNMLILIFYGFWWFFLAALICAFSGQSSKFIYIDF